MKATTYEWLPTICAPRNFPVEVLRGEFYHDSEIIARKPMQGYTAMDWGQLGTVDVPGDEHKPIPDRLFWKWFSLTERKAYEGDFDLRPLHLEQYFEKGYYNVIDQEHTNYRYIEVAMAPLGHIVIWLMGTGESRVVGAFQANPSTAIDTSDLLGSVPTIEEYVRMQVGNGLTPAQRDLKGVSDYELHKWHDDYLRLYRWTPRIILSQPVTMPYITFFSGDEIGWQDLQALEKEERLRVPKSMSFNWDQSPGQARKTYCDFDEMEIMAAFKALSLGDGDKKPLYLQIEVNAVNYVARAFLHDDTHMVELKKAVIKTYDANPK